MSVSLCCPWRSVWLARGVALVALATGVPLFLRAPPWCDLTLYQMAARNIIEGGTHYRDVFDTNLPGFVWALTAIQFVFGESVVAVRAADLLIVAGVVALIDRVVARAGASLAGRWWAVAGAAVFYPFTVEMSHAQRDTWMALPVLAALALRLRRPPGAGAAAVRASLCEGALWGAAVWVKPHVVVMAAAVWLLTARRLAGERPRPWRALAPDLLGNVGGGLAIGAAGVAWLFATGTWGPFVDVFANWNPGYLDLVLYELKDREAQQLYWFPPWSLGLIPTVPLAAASVLDMRPWSSRAPAGPRGFVGRWLPGALWDREAGADARFARGALGALYLAWAAQAYYLQRGFEYAHIPETLLMLGVWASHRWAWVPLVLLWLAVTTSAWALAGTSLGALPGEAREHHLPSHPMFRADRLALWPRCWNPTLSDAERYALWDALRLHPPHEAVISWEELDEVARFLRAQGVSDYEMIAWFDSPHALYMTMHLKPGTRFMHVNTAMSIGQWRTDEPGAPRSGRAKVMDELRTRTPRARFVVNDLAWVTLSAATAEQRAAWTAPARKPPEYLLPAETPYPQEFPFNQPTVFRTRNNTGRYVVHALRTRGHDTAAEIAVTEGARSVVHGTVWARP